MIRDASMRMWYYIVHPELSPAEINSLFFEKKEYADRDINSFWMDCGCVFTYVITRISDDRYVVSISVFVRLTDGERATVDEVSENVKEWKEEYTDGRQYSFDIGDNNFMVYADIDSSELSGKSAIRALQYIQEECVNIIDVASELAYLGLDGHYML